MKSLFLLSMLTALSFLTTGCETVDYENDDDDDDGYRRPASTTTTTTSVRESRVAPYPAATEETRVIRY
ncbi:MAG: hypothetical protein ACR2OZ_18080 [Verrucomicrobiales bacterium]